MNTPNSPTQALDLLEAILSEMGRLSKLSKPRLRFMRWLFGAWLGLPVRRTMSNLARFGPYCEKSIRLHLERGFGFAEFCRLLIEKRCGVERVAAFDPSFVRKAGQHTYGVDWWWCGTLQKVMRGLELGVLGVIDVQARSAFALQATQTPPLKTLHEKGHSLMEHYVGLVQEQAVRLRQLGVQCITADAYFAKKSWVDGLVELKFHVVTRLRQDANLRYLYSGPQKPLGRRKQYDGKVDCQKIDKRRLRLFQQDEHARYYSAVVYAVALQRVVRIVYIESQKINKGNKGNREGRSYRILMSSDRELAPEKIVEYYQLRFQIEFLIRDAKTHAGLEECQARNPATLEFHFNMALSAVSWAKAAFWMQTASQTPPPPTQRQIARGPFSLRNIKLLFTSDLWTHRVFQNLDLDLSLNQYQHAYSRCLDLGNLAV